MSKEPQQKKDEIDDEFAQAAEEAQTGIVREFFDFLLHNKKWWLTPIVIVLLLLIVMAYISATSPAAAPFIYTLF